MKTSRNGNWLKEVLFLFSFFCSSAFFSFPQSVYAVGGISGSKLIVPSADPVAYGDFELEPYFSVFRAHRKYNEYGHLKNIPDDFDRLSPGEVRESRSEGGLGFRMTGGVLPNFEAGFGYMITERWQPIIEIGYFESYSRRFRDFIIPKYQYVDLNINNRLDIPLKQELLFPGFGVIGRRTPTIQENVKVWERKWTGSIGFTYTVNKNSLVVLGFSQDIAGVNLPAGRTIAGAFTFTFKSEK